VVNAPNAAPAPATAARRSSCLALSSMSPAGAA
jgi:hypothetical protein